MVGYSPWGHKESDTTEALSSHTHHDMYKKNKIKNFLFRPRGSEILNISIKLLTDLAV